MSISTIISLARDVFIVAALGFVIWWIHSSGEDHVKLKDMAAVQKQLAANAVVEKQNAEDAATAQVIHDQELEDIAHRIASQRAPVFMCPRSPDTSLVSGHPAPTQNGHEPTQSGTADAGSGIDIRAAVNAFESKYEQALSDCRQVISSWPH